MSTYQEMSGLYRDSEGRSRYDMCAREQAFIYSAQGGAVGALGVGIIGGDLNDIDAVIAAIVTGPNSDQLGQDGPLLAAVQAVWPAVAAARYPV